MVDGSGDDSADGGRPEEGGILSPHELDITESEHVEQIEEGRFVVSPEARTGRRGTQSPGGQPRRGEGEQRSRSQPQSGQNQQKGGDNSTTADTTPSASRGRSGQSGSPNQLTEDEVRNWLRQKYEQSNSKYAFDVTAQFEGKVSQRRLASNDLVTVFESLILWYGQQVDSNMPIEEVLGILLMESNVPVRYPPESVRTLVKSTDLTPDDTIADLLVAVQNEDGIQL